MKKLLRFGAVLAAFAAIGRVVMGRRRHDDEEEA